MPTIKRRSEKWKKLWTSEELNPIDWAVFFLLALLCYFTMQQGDILHTAGSSFSLLKGHVLDFYEYTAKYLGGNAYMISTYVLFAIWNVPLYLIGAVRVPTMRVPTAVLMWYKALPTICFIVSAYIIYRILIRIDFNKRIAILSAYAFLAMPIAFYSQFCFGQYDVFTVLFMLLGIWFYFGNQPRDFLLFSFCFGIAVTFKYHALFYFVPLLVLKEKRLWELIKQAAVCALPVIFANLPYLRSSRFQTGVAEFGAIDYVTSASLEYLFGKIYIIPLLWIGVCAYSYMIKKDKTNKELLQWSMFICSMVNVIAFGLMMWHPQWLMIAAPIMALSLTCSERKDVLCLFDTALSCVYFMYTTTAWTNHLDQKLFSLGVLGSHLDFTRAITMYQIYPYHDLSFMFTIFGGLLLASAWMKYPRISPKSDMTKRAEVNWIRARFYLPMAFFLVPMFICFASAKYGILLQPQLILKESPDEKTLQITCVVEDDYDEVLFPVWSEVNGQDDLTWYEAELVRKVKGTTTWAYTVDLESHHSSGKYCVDAYAKKGAKQKRIAGADVIVGEEETSIDANGLLVENNN